MIWLLFFGAAVLGALALLGAALLIIIVVTWNDAGKEVG